MVLATRLYPFLFTAIACGIAAAQRTPEEALRALRDGNKRYHTDHSVPQPVGEGVRRTLARGQSPFAIVLCCADSRVPPEHVFNAGLGELFVVRVAGHTADPETVASIEYAVEHLGASLCVVLGHEKCGAVAATVAQVDQLGHDSQHSPALQQLLEHIEPAVRKAKGLDLGGKSLHDVCEEEHAHVTVHDCFRRSALLRRFASVGKFRMVAARYHLQSGEVEWLPNRPLPTEPRADDHAVHGAAPNSVPPHVALRLLQAGHRRFVGDSKPTADLTAERREVLAHGQQPTTIVLTCADSRVAPEHVFDAGLGELFVIRIAGNIVNDDALASIEYAASHLGASLLVVMGHTKCGAVQAATQSPAGHELSPNLRALLLRIEPSVAVARAEGKGRDLVDLAVRANAMRAVTEARSRSATLRALEHEGRFTMLGCVYDIASGDVEWLKDAAEPPASHARANGAKATASQGNDHDAHAHEPAKPAAKAAHPAPAHGNDAHAKPHAAANDLPVLDWAGGHAAPAGETAHQAGHAAHETPSAEGHAATHDSHGSHNSHDAPAAPSDHTAPAHAATSDHAHDAHDGHDHAEHGAHTHANDSHQDNRTAPALWKDPVVLVGITGVVSLLAAAVLAMKKR